MIACDGDDGETGASGILGPTGNPGETGADGTGIEHIPVGFHVDLFEGGTYLCAEGFHYEYALDDGHVVITDSNDPDFNTDIDHDGTVHDPACRDADGALPVISP